MNATPTAQTPDHLINAGNLPPRTEMKCRVCGQFSSAQVCWHCSTNPAGLRVLELERENARLCGACHVFLEARKHGNYGIEDAEKAIRAALI